MKHYISQTIVEYIEGKLSGREVVITRADSRVDKKSALYANVKRFKRKLEYLGIENLHVNEYEKSKYNRLVREQNKYRKTVKLTVADIARMTEQASEEEEK